ncbi:MAG: hypothetical protein QHJ73_05865, partial [Armatimonadota bacterium]|nr:hypothetical protein [Armatimonadota bacterium]
MSTGSPRVRVLVCDLGNVVLPLDHGRAFRALGARLQADVVRTCVARALRETGFGQGKCSPETFFRRLQADLGLDLSFDAFRRVWSDIFWEAPQVVALVRRARVARRYLLSNTDPIHWEWITARFPNTLAPFDRLFVSHEIGVEKPDPRAYRLVMEESGEPPGAH